MHTGSDSSVVRKFEMAVSSSSILVNESFLKWLLRTLNINSIGLRNGEYGERKWCDVWWAFPIVLQQSSRSAEWCKGALSRIMQEFFGSFADRWYRNRSKSMERTPRRVTEWCTSSKCTRPLLWMAAIRDRRRPLGDTPRTAGFPDLKNVKNYK